jgi:hypothetical protein
MVLLLTCEQFNFWSMNQINYYGTHVFIPIVSSIAHRIDLIVFFVLARLLNSAEFCLLIS